MREEAIILWIKGGGAHLFEIKKGFENQMPTFNGYTGATNDIQTVTKYLLEIERHAWTTAHYAAERLQAHLVADHDVRDFHFHQLTTSISFLGCSCGWERSATPNELIRQYREHLLENWKKSNEAP
jgi:hypothetical protein